MNPDKPHVLLTNDDGIDAPGLAALADKLIDVSNLTIIAPRHECSAGSHSITLFRDMILRPVENGDHVRCWGLEGTPADCVKVAVRKFSAERPFDMVVSGINHGQNAGADILYSGTVAAAREAAVKGIPSIAVSLKYNKPEIPNFETAARITLEIFEKTVGKEFPPGSLLNVNIPPVAYDDLKGWAVTSMGNSAYVDHFLSYPGIENPDCSSVFKNIGEGWIPSLLLRKDTDDRSIVGHRVSITPLQYDQTDYGFMECLENWFQ